MSTSLQPLEQFLFVRHEIAYVNLESLCPMVSGDGLELNRKRDKKLSVRQECKSTYLERKKGGIW